MTIAHAIRRRVLRLLPREGTRSDRPTMVDPTETPSTSTKVTVEPRKPPKRHLHSSVSGSARFAIRQLCDRRLRSPARPLARKPKYSCATPSFFSVGRPRVSYATVLVRAWMAGPGVGTCPNVLSGAGSDGTGTTLAHAPCTLSAASAESKDFDTAVDEPRPSIVRCLSHVDCLPSSPPTDRASATDDPGSSGRTAQGAGSAPVRL
jgi:hypothetical protein